VFDDFPDDVRKSKVELRVGDIYDGLDAAIANGETYDVVAVLAFYIT
jgi:hypothetical protein